ncbi:MAG: methyltransferase domain-containing protein [Gammaproteobacteria bacterium]|nr:methyltransferase domain-containing protein [Gammaproteobacteria bacterium]
MTEEIPAQFFARVDEAPDADFYTEPRLVAHIDPETIAALTAFYEEFVPPGADVLDLMSSWISHLPTLVSYGRVAGLGMNTEELAANPQLSEYCVHDLNVQPNLPYESNSFDTALIAVSIQYLIRPVQVLRSVANVLRPGGRICIAISHRVFPTKAILAFRQLEASEKVQLVATYLQSSGYEKVDFIDRSPPQADPLWLLVANVPGSIFE